MKHILTNNSPLIRLTISYAKPCNDANLPSNNHVKKLILRKLFEKLIGIINRENVLITIL